MIHKGFRQSIIGRMFSLLVLTLLLLQQYGDCLSISPREGDDSTCLSADRMAALMEKFLDRFERIENELSLTRTKRQAEVEGGGGEQGGGNDNSNKVDRTFTFQDLLPDDYDKRQAPPQVSNDSVNQIRVTMDIYSIPQLDEKKEEIMLEVRLSHYWFDLRLRGEDIPEPVELVPEAISEFWTPDSYFHHAKDAKEVKLITNPASLRITPDKQIKYTMMTMVTVGCPMRFHYYPMDQQICRLELQSFGYNLDYNNYTWKRDPYLKKDINLDNHAVEIDKYYFTYTSDGTQYPGLGVKIELKRHLIYHVIQTYVPSIIYVTVAWLSFLVPSDIVPGRMVLCVTTLLTLTSMFNSVRTMTPQVSYMKGLDLWVFCCICFVFTSLVEYGLVLHLTSRSGWQKKVDKHIRGATGKPALKTLSPVTLLGVTVNAREKRIRDGDNPDVEYNDTSKNHMTISTTPPGTAGDPSIPNSKERMAYAIEWGIKIAYPVAFMIFNACYWSFYLRKYNEVLVEPEEDFGE